VGDEAKPMWLPHGADAEGGRSKAKALIKELDSDVGVEIWSELDGIDACCSKL
jgi:hypothetical protein